VTDAGCWAVLMTEPGHAAVREGLVPGVGAPAKPRHPAGDELVEPDGLAAQRIKGVARDAAGRPSDNGADIGLLDQCVNVDAPDYRIDVHPGQQLVEVHLGNHGVQVDLPNEVVHVQRVHHQVDRVLCDDLGSQFQRVRHPLAHGTQPINRIHEIKCCRFGAPWITHGG
jgi:hypothetical protein